MPVVLRGMVSGDATQSRVKDEEGVKPPYKGRGEHMAKRARRCRAPYNGFARPRRICAAATDLPTAKDLGATTD